MSLGTFSDTVSASSISDHMYGKVLRTYLLGKTDGGDSRDEPRITFAKWLFRNWNCSIPLSEIGYDQYFTGLRDIIIKFKEENATIIGGITGHTDFFEASPFLVPIYYRSRIDIYIEVRANVPDPMPYQMNTIKSYIKNFVKARPIALRDEGIMEMYNTAGYYNYPEQRDKNTFKDQLSVMMKYAKLYR